MTCLPKPPRPCECGCGAPIAQKQRKGSPKRFASDACQKRAAKAAVDAAAAEKREAREHRRLTYPLTRDAELANYRANRERRLQQMRDYDKKRRQKQADHPESV